ncbi:MAG: hypothetical protein JNK05_00570 [Myxococcales bacterium]|nr:hypothetical protein [Myxococcales bacterium]
MHSPRTQQPSRLRATVATITTAVAAVSILVVLATPEDAEAQRRTRRRSSTAAAQAAVNADAGAAPNLNATAAVAGTAASAGPRGDDPSSSTLPLNQAVNFRNAQGTLTLTGSRAWPVRSALAWRTEDGMLTILLHSNPVVCPANAGERGGLANMLAIDCRGTPACRMALITVPVSGPLTPMNTTVSSPSAQQAQISAAGNALQNVDRNNPAAMQAAIATMQAQANRRPTTAVLAWKNDRGASLSEAVDSGNVELTAVNGRTLEGTLSLRFAGAPSRGATGTPSLDGRFTLTLCP